LHLRCQRRFVGRRIGSRTCGGNGPGHADVERLAGLHLGRHRDAVGRAFHLGAAHNIRAKRLPQRSKKQQKTRFLEVAVFVDEAGCGGMRVRGHLFPATPRPSPPPSRAASRRGRRAGTSRARGARAAAAAAPPAAPPPPRAPRAPAHANNWEQVQKTPVPQKAGGRENGVSRIVCKTNRTKNRPTWQRQPIFSFTLQGGIHLGQRRRRLGFSSRCHGDSQV
jgi:hypothetical protein